ncbi:MAG: hypothetical protein RL662_2245 [Bacteroidota bacterium]|jgi:DNA-binding MarR family transcriptional regulator
MIYNGSNASLIDMRIWRELRDVFPAFHIIKYILLTMICEGSIQARNNKNERVVIPPCYLKCTRLDVKQIIREYHIHASSISRHLAYLKEKGLIRKEYLGYYLAEGIEELFKDSTDNIDNENILIFDGFYLKVCKSSEEGLILSYLARKFIDTDIKNVSVPEIMGSLLLDRKTVKGALGSLKDNSLIEVDKDEIRVPNIIEKYKLLKNEFKNPENCNFHSV